MKTKEILQLGKEELLAKEQSLKKELFDLNFQRKFSQVEKPGRFKQIRKEIARIKTIQRQRELEENNKNDSESK